MIDKQFEYFTTIKKVDHDIAKYCMMVMETIQPINGYAEISPTFEEIEIILDKYIDNFHHDYLVDKIIEKTNSEHIIEIERYHKDTHIWSRKVLSKIQGINSLIYMENRMSNDCTVLLHPRMNKYLCDGTDNSRIPKNFILDWRIPMKEIYIFGISRSNDLKPLVFLYNDNKFNISNDNCNTKKLIVKSKLDEREQKLKRILW